ncbi:hypothetical protein F5Y12DRAFT_355263 [Xylaria sp. FL1777]|nr:hypothetical protein F5Y12DRAFT_355263 [Xylaria sp. FL1777]
MKLPAYSVSLRDKMSMIYKIKGVSIHNLAHPGDRENGRLSTLRTNQASIRWNMGFTWQTPMVLLAYSVIAFLTGVTIYVTTPLYIDDPSLGGKSAAIFYLVGLFIGGSVFVWCSSWAHRFVNLDGPLGVSPSI